MATRKNKSDKPAEQQLELITDQGNDMTLAEKLELFGVERPDRLPVDRPQLVPIDALTVRKFSDKQVEFTYDKAAEYSNLPIWEGERDVDSSNVERLISEMKKERFNWDNVVIAKCLYQGLIYKINGQHTAVARFAMPETPSPMVREILYATDQLGQLKALYSTFDRPKPRSNSHLTRVELAGSEAAEGLHGATIGLLSAGLKFWKYPDITDYKRIDPAEIAHLAMSDHSQLFNMVGKFYQSLDPDMAKLLVQRRPAIAAMFETFSRYPAESVEFWKNMVEGTNLNKDDARWHLRNYLSTANVDGRRSVKTGKVVVDSEDLYRICMSAWKKWKGNEKVAMLRTTSKRLPA